MFNLRKEQLSIFETVAAKDFESRVAARLKDLESARCASLDGAALVDLVRYGIERAKSYGVTAEPDVCKFLVVMLQLGKDFDANPRYPWAARTLNDAGLGDPSARVSRLAAEALDSIESANAKGAGSRE